MSNKKMSDNNALVSFSDAIVNLAEETAPSIVGVQTKTMQHGSGVVLSTNGHIVSCYHILKSCTEARIALNGNLTISAKVIGADPYSDIALLKIKERSNLKPIEIGDSENIRIGQFVLAMANAYGDHVSITTGIVTTESSSIRGWSEEVTNNTIITDARLNRGYSGGPLLDVQGKMIGINVANISSRGVAIRSTKMKNTVDTIMNYK